MAKRNSQRSSSKVSIKDPRTFIITLIGAIIVGLAALFGGVGGGLVEQDNAPPATTSSDVFTPNVTLGASSPDAVTTISVGRGFGAAKDFWQVYFTAPVSGNNAADLQGGIDVNLAPTIDQVQSTLDIAAYEWNSRVLTDAVIRALQRGVRVRMVVDDEATIEDSDTTIQEVISAGAQVIDDSRGGLMHNKFMILNSTIVWMGSTNYTFNDVYRNNNNMMMMRSQEAVRAYQAEFNEMFERGEFGQRRSQVNGADFTLDGTRVRILFAPEDNVIPSMVDLINSAQSSVYFMTFSFTVTEIGDAVIDRASAGVNVEGIFETTGSETRFSQLTPLFCAGLDVRQDGNRGGMLHHKVFIIDESIVLTGSFNVSANATNDNDENLVIIYDRDLAAQYLAEFRRMQSQATRPTDLTCS